MIIRDAIHGDMYISEEEKNIIDTIEMQRLRGIKQLGTANLVYPTALHTRFDHSLGVNAVLKKLFYELKNKEIAKNILAKTNLLPLQIASLLHDITHIPFGHTFEDEMLIFDKHDKIDRYEDMLGQGQIGERLNKMGILEEIIKLLSTKDPEQDLDEPWHAQIITNTVCADILDYLRRDSYFCGFNKDYDDRIFKYFDLQKKDGKYVIVLNLTKGKMLRDDALTELIHIMRLRFFLAQRAYLHHTKVCSGAMLAKALNIAKDYRLSKKHLYEFTDEIFMEFLLKYPSNRPDPRITKLVSRVISRDLLKRAYVLSPKTISHPANQQKFIGTYHEDDRERDKKEAEIAEEAKIDAEEVIIYCMGFESLKEADVYVRTGGDDIQKLSDLPNQRELESITQSYMNIWKFYVFAPQKKVTEVHDLCENIFEHKSEYIPKQYKKGLDKWMQNGSQI